MHSPGHQNCFRQGYHRPQYLFCCCKIISGRAQPAKLVLERDTWLVEKFINPEGVQKLPEAQMKHKIQASYEKLF